MSNDVDTKKNANELKPSEKIVIYTLNKDGNEYTYYVTFDFEKLQGIVKELEKCRYKVNGKFKPTYLEYILRSLLNAITNKTFKHLKTITFEKNSNNMINSIVNYEYCGELDNEKTDKSVIPSTYKREFDLEILRDLYRQVKECITFKEARRTISTDDGTIDIGDMQRLHRK